MIIAFKNCEHCSEQFARPRAYSARQWAIQRFCGKKCWIEATTAQWPIRFHAGYEKTESGCWVWTRGRHGKGYGLFHVPGKTIQKTHRVSWEMHNGEIPDGLHVLHRCDNPPCVNPEHLFLGTNQDNVDDKVAKGRLRVQRGSSSGVARLTEDQVVAIRADGRFQREIAETYGIAQTTVSAIKRRQNWAHL